MFLKGTIRMLWDIFVSWVFRSCKENWINPEQEINWIPDLNKIFAYVGNLPWVKKLENIDDVLDRSITACGFRISIWSKLHPWTIAWIITYLYLINTVTDYLKESEEKVIIEKVKEKFYTVDSVEIFWHKV